jgi:hypothetical protein
MEQLKTIVRMTRKKVMEDGKAHYKMQTQDKLNAIQINENATQELEKMKTMELFINNLIDEEGDSMEEEEDELTQAKLDELTASLST